MKRTQHSGCFIFLIEVDWLNFALDTGADFHWLNTEQLYLDVSLYSNTCREKFSWGGISIHIHIRYSMNSKANIRIQWIRIFFASSHP